MTHGGLDKVKGYVDGMIPLLLVAVMMAVVTAGGSALPQLTSYKKHIGTKGLL